MSTVMSFHTIRMFPVAMLACVASLEVQAQLPPPPPQCTTSTCTIRLANAGSPVVDGCGEHATLGRFKVTLSSSNPNVTRQSFTTVKFLSTRNTNRAGAEFTDWEWRTPEVNSNAWQNVLGGRDSLTFAGGALGENIVEVRPKAGAHIWSNRTANNPIRGPGELVVQVITPGPGRRYATAGSTYFLFMGGKGCARVGPGGELLGGNQ